MKIQILFIFVFAIFAACNSGSHPQPSEKKHTDLEELNNLYKQDQADRQSNELDWEKISERDRLRRQRVYDLLDSNKVNTSKDYSNAAMIFQHGGDTIASGMAVKLMKKALELDSTANKWLLAAAIDRDLMRKNQPQIYGTQYHRQGADEPWKLYDLDSTKITDEERSEYGVETLAEQRLKVKKMNLKKLSALYRENKSIDEIIKLCTGTDLKNSEYDLSESGINSFGYSLLAENRNQEALKIFQLNTSLYPDAFNTYDSLGECLLKLGKTEEGIIAYQKSLELNPGNQNAIDVLAELKKN